MDSHASNLSKGNGPSSESARAGVEEQQGRSVPQLRLIARGSSPVEDPTRYLGRRQAARSRNSIELNLSGAAKKRSGVPPRAAISAATVTPSPTTQIAAGMNLIALDQSPMGGPASIHLPPVSSLAAADDREGGHRRARTPQGDPERVGGKHQALEYMDTGTTSSRTHSGSPPSLPEVGTNIEVSTRVVTDSGDLSRPEHAAYMKRAANTDGQDDEGEGNYKMARIGTVEKVSSLGSSIRVSTIITPSSSSSTKRQRHTKHSSPSISPTTEHPQHSPRLSPSPSSTPSPQPQSTKLSGFTINDILKGSTNSSSKPASQHHPVAASPYPYHTAMLILPQLPTGVLLSPPHLPANHANFHGEISQRDNYIPITNTSTVASSVHHAKSPSHGPSSVTVSTAGHYSPNTSPIHCQETSSDVVETENEPSEGYHSMETREKEREREGRQRTEGRQNALLQVSEAHLAILPDEDGDTPLHLAIIHENLSLTYYLVKLIVGVAMNLDIANNLRQTPLHLAIITKQPNAVKMLIQEGASVNYPDRRGNTSVHLASSRKELGILHVLSQAASPSPDFNARNFSGLTPVHVATKEANIDVLKFLFQVGANRNLPDTASGRTPLHYAVEQEDFTLCNFLLENNCNVNAATFSGNTPLHIAAGRKLKEIVALLMAYGANPAIANGEGDFPSDLPASLLMQRAKMNAH